MRRICCLFRFGLLSSAWFLLGASILAPSAHGLQQDTLKDPTIARASQTAGSSNRTSKLRTTYAGLWRVDRHFEATIHLKNSLITGPLTVTPALIMADGTEYPLPAIEMGTAGTAEVSINRAIENAPVRMKSHVSQYGSAVVRYQSMTKAPLDGFIEIREPLQRLAFANSFQTYDASSPSPGNTELHGLWWKHDPRITGFFSLSNITESPVLVKVQVIGSAGTAAPPQNISVAGHNTRLLSLDDFGKGLPEQERKQGGIEINYGALRGSIMVTGGLENADEGYSSPILFLLQSEKIEEAADFTLASVDMLLGKPDPMMQFPAGTVFKPFAALRNTTTTSIQVIPTLYYRPRMDSAQTKAIPLAVLNLKPQESIQLDLSQQSAALNLDHYNGSINLVFSYKGRNADLLVDTASIDQTGNFVFEANPQEVGESGAKQICSWRVANNDDTLLSLWNPANSTQDLSVKLYFEGGTRQYVVPVHLEPLDLVELTLSQILLQNRADAEGNILPPNLRTGSAVISNAKSNFSSVNVVLNGNIVSGRNPMALCTGCIGEDDLEISPDPGSCGVGDTYQFSSLAHFKNGTTTNETTAGTWTSSNTAIATIGSKTGLLSGIAPGQITIQECVLEPDSNQDCFNQGERGCHNLTICTPVPMTVGPVITGISPSQGLVGTATSVTITGRGFTGATLAPASGANIAVSNVTVTSDSQINASLTPTNSKAGGGNQGINVTANGQRASTNFFGQVPTGLTIISVNVLPTGTDQSADGCIVPPGGDFGIKVAATYQINDQRTPTASPINSSAMEPQETITNQCINGTCSNPVPTFSDIGPSRISGTSQFTNSNGQFEDAPLGICGSSSFTATVTQTIQALVGGSSGTGYQVRVNNFSISGPATGQGSIGNSSDISKSRP